LADRTSPRSCLKAQESQYWDRNLNLDVVHSANVKPHFGGIDLLRFFAAVMVTVFHLAFWSWAPEISTPKEISGGFYQYPELSGLSSAGWVGVEIFFVISGFVIVFSAKASAWQFLRSRVLRLVPAAWICAPITAILLIFFTTYPTGDLIKRLVRSLSFWPFPSWVDGVYWTLGIEIVFYSFIFVLLVFRQQKYLVLGLSVIGCASALYWMLPITKESSRAIELTLLPHGCFFAIGGLLWAILCNGANKWLWAIIAFSSIGGVLEIYHVSAPRASLAGTSASTLFALSFWMAGNLVIILSVRYAHVVSSYLSGGWVRSLGLATYPLYLLHDVMGAAILKSLASLGFGRWLALILALAIPLIVSFAVALLLERRLKTMLSHIIDSNIFSIPRRIVDFRWV
jgi:peptidoglycan/LPS O-acetylase OafA/YrhL